MGKLIDIGRARGIMRDYRDVVGAVKSGLGLEGLVTCEHMRNGRLLHIQYGKNIFTTVGLNHILNVALDGTTAKIGTWYVGIFKTNVTPIAGDTSAKLGAGNAYGECQDADYATPATNKPAYNEAAASAGVMTNSANKAAFTMAATITVYGAFLGELAVKTATTGILLAAKQFTSARSVVSGDVLNVTYQITATSS